MKIQLMLLLAMMIISGLAADTYYVPSDYPTIQTGIDSLEDGDVLLVSPNRYFENINYLSKNITVASLYYTTQDTSYISQTIIDGANNGSVVTIDEVDSGNPVLCGFTIQNGSSPYGGGIYCHNSDASLSDLIIQDNRATGSMATDMGGGIYSSASILVMNNVQLRNNFGERGGGLCCGSVELNNVDFIGNTSRFSGGGMYCDIGNIAITNGSFTGNSARQGGGIFNDNSAINLAGVTFTGNHAILTGGGISNNSNIEFSIEDRCNIYLNNVENRYGGSDIYSNEPLEVCVDTFTVQNPTGFHAYPEENFTFDILHGIQNQVNCDLYISPAGDNDNSGLSSDDPLKTIQYACSIILADSENPHTIFLAEGVYSQSDNGEYFPINLPPYVSLIGSGRDDTVLDAFCMAGILRIVNSDDIEVSAMTLTNGMEISQSGISCSNSTVELSNLAVNNCIAEIGAGGINLSGGSYDLHNIIISNNSGHDGGGIFISGTDAVSMDSLIIENNNTDDKGGGICAYLCDLQISNSRICNNTAESIGGGIYLYDEVSLSLNNVEIDSNRAINYRAGGIFVSNMSVLEMSDVTITDNYCSEAGGGIVFEEGAEAVFDPENRCDIYLNNSGQRSAGADIYSMMPIEVIVDTFTVMIPTDYHAMPIDNFTFDILNSRQQQIASDLYVSPDGDNANSGISEEEPLKTIQYACSIIQADSLDHRTIYLLPGVYSASENGEFFPVSLPDNVTLAGITQGDVILDAENNSTAVNFQCSVNNTLSNLKIINGYSKDGAGIWCYNSSPNLYNISLQYNNGFQSYGAAIFIFGESNPLLSGVNIQYNNGCHGAGIAVRDASATLIDVLIEDNSASRKGGGLNCIDSEVILQNVTIAGNFAQQNGAGIYCEGSNLIMTNCLINNNTALEPGGGVYCAENSFIQINNSTFSQNSAQSGSGLFAGYHSEAYLVNCIFWDNENEEIHFYGTTSYADRYCLVYSDIQDGSNGIILGSVGVYHITEGNIDQNPLFTSPQHNDFTLQNGSPCIDTGIDSYEYNDLLLIDLDETQYFGAAPDMGCYEYDPVETNELIIQNLKLKIQNYPNPFNPSTTIYFSLPAASHTELAVYNIKGQLVQILIDEILSAGDYTRIWNGCDSINNDLGSGIYLLSLQVNESVNIRKITLIK
jgi:hypothetical protein